MGNFKRTHIRIINSKIINTMPSALGLNFIDKTPERSNLLLYDIGEGNWAGIGVDYSGVVHLNFGTHKDKRTNYAFTVDGIYMNDVKITV